MEREIAQETAKRIAKDCLAVRVRLLSRVVTGVYDDVLRPLEIKVSQLNVLVVVANYDSPTPTKIGQVLHMEKSTLSRNVERMVARGWLRIATGKDVRTHRVTITPKGRTLLEKSLPLWQQAQEESEALLGERVTRVVCQAADRIWADGKS